MAWKKKPIPEKGSREHHLANIAIVTRRHPDYQTIPSRWSVETAWLDAAYLYEFGDGCDMPDSVWDALGYYLAKTWSKRSPFFKNCVDRSVLRKKPTSLAIHWSGPLGLAVADFWTDKPAPETKRVIRPKPKPKSLKRLIKVRKRPIARR